MISSKKIFLLLFLTFLISLSFFSCKKEVPHKSNDLAINITKKSTVGPFLRFLSPFLLVDSIPSQLKGIPQLDSIILQRLNLVSPTRIKKIYQADSISKTEYENFITGFYTITGYENDHQFYIIDSNNNFDFSDEKKVVFNRDLSTKTHQNLKVRDSFEIIQTSFNDFVDGNIVNVQKNIRIFPYKNYFSFSKPTKLLNLYSSLQLVSETNEHWIGGFKSDTLNFEIAINSSPLTDYQMIIREDNKPFPETRNSQYFKHKLLDTLKLDNNYYRLDSIDLAKSKLFMKELGELKSYYGYLTDDIVKNIKFKNLDGNEIVVKDLLKEKGFLLIDFWGTWCGPCIELTPELLRINKENDNINILSVAFENNAGREKVIEYVEKHNMNWTHTYELKNKLNKQNSFVSNLKVGTFPTFILLDKDLKIVYRGFGGDALKEIETFISEN